MRQFMRALMTGLAAAAALVLATLPARADAPEAASNLPVALSADLVEYDTEAGLLTASGNVEIYYGERTLTADRIVYDSNTGRITATGGIVLRDPSGATVFADFADLDAELRNGLVRGARAVMGENIKLSAAEARRVEARFNVLSKAVYSPCKVCPDDPVPLWRIRARRVIHDEVERVIHYEDATLDVFGVPIAWLPYFSHPDPTVKRASGFLVPEFRQSSVYGYGARVPYYWVIDDHSDLTFSPLITSGDGVIGVIEYRRAFASGDFTTAGSLTRNDYQGSNELHGHIEARGEFDLAGGIRWGFDGIAATDRGYLRRFDFSDEDRLTSELYLRRYRNDGFADLTAVYFQSLRDDEPAGQIPIVLPDFDARHEMPGVLLGGDLGLFTSARVLLRGEGLDTSRLSLGADWQRQVILPVGLSLRGFAELRGDLFVSDDFGGIDSATELRFAPLAGVEARFPLIHESSGGVIHVLEPIAQAIIAPNGGNSSDIPNEDSQVTEFDETNLFDTSHFTGLDAFEEGPRLNLGLRYERISPGGLNFDASVGRVLRLRGAGEFSSGSGLADAASDWVGAWSASYDPYVTVRQRLRISDDFTVTRNEFGAKLSFGRFAVSANYIFLERDPSIEAPREREELTARARFRLTRYWSVSGDARRDLERGDFVQIGGGLTFANECCQVDFLVKRDFRESDDAPDSTSFVVQIKLFTLGNADNSAR
ncbi:MAG: LPS-assembly protein LptD [Proteobacteria bacterium]|nr:LPS-assembly protein LptD [Pseudomonadota bacterium]